MHVECALAAGAFVRRQRRGQQPTASTSGGAGPLRRGKMAGGEDAAGRAGLRVPQALVREAVAPRRLLVADARGRWLLRRLRGWRGWRRRSASLWSNRVSRKCTDSRRRLQHRSHEYGSRMFRRWLRVSARKTFSSTRLSRHCRPRPRQPPTPPAPRPHCQDTLFLRTRTSPRPPSSSDGGCNRAVTTSPTPRA